MFAKFAVGHIVFSLVSISVGVLCVLFWDEDAGLWSLGHGWEVWLHVVCGAFYLIPGIFGCLVEKKKNNSMVNICMTTSFYATVMTAVQILFATYTIVSAQTSTMIMISASLIVIAVLEFLVCIITIIFSGRALKDLRRAKMTRTRSRSSFLSRYHPAARFNPLAIETLSEERYHPTSRSLVSPATRHISYSTTHIAPSKSKTVSSPTGVRKQTRFSSTPNLTFPDPPREPPPPLEMEPPDITSRTELVLAANVNPSHHRPSGGHIRSSTPDVAPSRDSSLHRNSYREMRREQSQRYQQDFHHPRENSPGNTIEPGGYDPRRHNPKSSRDQLNDSGLAHNAADDIWVPKQDAKRTSAQVTQDQQNSVFDYRREVRLDPRQLQVQENRYNDILNNQIESNENPPPIPPRDPKNMGWDTKVEKIDNRVSQQNQDHRHPRGGAPPTTAHAGRHTEKHHGLDEVRHDRRPDYHRATHRQQTTDTTVQHSTPVDATKMNSKVWRDSDPPDIDYRRHPGGDTHPQKHPNKVERGDTHVPKKQPRQHNHQTPNEKRRDPVMRRDRHDGDNRNSQKNERTGSNNPQVREALAEYVKKSQYRNKDHKTANERHGEHNGQYDNHIELKRSQYHKGYNKADKHYRTSGLSGQSDIPMQTQSVANDNYMTQSSHKPENQKSIMGKGQHSKYGPSKRQYKSADDLDKDDDLPAGFQVKLRVRDNEGTLGNEIFYYSSTSLFHEETDI